MSNEEKYLYFLLAKAFHSLAGQKIEKNPNFSCFSIVSSKLFNSEKIDSKDPKKQPPGIIKLKMLKFQVKTIGKKGFANKF